jgi:3-oxo-4,17-pregnadiene-20-carboxyl-CoA hydratase beta subunit
MPASSTPRAAVQVGDELEPFSVLITQQKLVMEAGANRDFAQIHFEREAARATGAPDIYANTIFLEGLIEACLRRWAGSDAVIEEITFRMLTFNCVGDRIAARAIVREVDPSEGRAVLEIWIESPRGRTVDGRAVIRR